MNKKILIGIVLLLVAAAAAYWWYVMNNTVSVRTTDYINKRVTVQVGTKNVNYTLGQAAFGYSLSTNTSVEFSTAGNTILIKVVRGGKVVQQENIAF